MRTLRAKPIDAAADAGRRVRGRSRLHLSAMLHGDGGNCAAVVTDLHADGCRMETDCAAPIGSPVTVVFSPSVLIGGRIAWCDGASVGVAFCARLLPRAVAQATRTGSAAMDG